MTTLKDPIVFFDMDVIVSPPYIEFSEEGASA